MSLESPKPGAASPGGLFESVKTLAGTLLAMGHTRLELLSNDLEEERAWLSAMLQWTLVTLFCAGLGIIFATALLVVAFWDGYRLPVLCTLAVAFLLAAALAWRTVHNMARAKPRLFAASLAELSRDREQLRPSDE